MKSSEVIVFLCCLLCGPVMAQEDSARINGMIEKLEQKRPVFGIFSYDRSLPNASSVADSDLDFVIIDMEHAPLDFEALQVFLQGMISRRELHAKKGRLQPEVLPIVRLPQNGVEQLQFQIKQVLDIGAYGLVLPHMRSAGDVVAAVQAARYPQLVGSEVPEPRGLRGVAPVIASRYWGLPYQDYIQRADLWPLVPSGELLLMIQIENVEGVRNIEDIAAVPGIGAIFVGPTDLSASLGHAGNPEAPEVIDSISRVLAVCKRQNIPCGITANEANIQERLDQGFLILTLGSDSGLPSGPQSLLDRYGQSP